jgi:hypothetical protein
MALKQLAVAVAVLAATAAAQIDCTHTTVDVDTGNVLRFLNLSQIAYVAMALPCARRPLSVTERGVHVDRSTRTRTCRWKTRSTPTTSSTSASATSCATPAPARYTTVPFLSFFPLGVGYAPAS